MTSRTRGMVDEAAYYGLAALFYAAPRILYDIQIDEAEPTTFPPSTLIVTNHKRDLDSVVLTSSLYWLQRPPRRPLEFAGREDMFLRGFLAHYDVVPMWLRRLLYEIDLTRVMEALRVHPVRRFPERTLEEALREALLILGDRPVTEILTAEAAGDAGRPGGSPLRLSQVLAWGWREGWQRPASMGAFRPEVRPLLEERQRVVVRQQMDGLAAVVRRGGVLYLAPEGVISPDGRLQNFRSGLRLILERVPEARIRPACIVYDFMTPGRLRICITVGRLAAAPAPTPGGPEVARRWLAALHTMTASQVCSQVVWDRITRGEHRVPEALIVRETDALAAALAAEGLRVDPLLRRDPERCAAGWVAYAVRRGLGAVRGAVLHLAAGPIVSRPATHWGNPLRYAVTELRSVRAALAEGREVAASG